MRSPAWYHPGMETSSTRPDPRRHAWRDDLAADTLRDRVSAPRYATGVPRQVRSAVAPVRRAPSPDAALDTEALYGERVEVYEQRDGWAWAQLARDRYVGYLPLECLGEPGPSATHRVAVPATLVFLADDIKSPPVMCLGLNSEVVVAGTGSRLSRLTQGGFIITRHLTALTAFADDFVTVAERLIDTPYLWGGKTRAGLDCSGLVQIALQAAGIDAPRDSDMQASELGTAVPVGTDLAGLQRGDLICWKGHIGLMRDAATLLHANAHHMAVASEPLDEAVTRIAAAGSRLLAVRRLRRSSVPPAAA